MKIRVPSKRICERFHLTYELEGAKKGVDVLTEYYGIRRMEIILNPRKVPKKWRAYYEDDKAYFRKEGLKKRLVLHELYHHIVEAKGTEMPKMKEERMASLFVREVMKKR